MDLVLRLSRRMSSQRGLYKCIVVYLVCKRISPLFSLMVFLDFFSLWIWVTGMVFLPFMCTFFFLTPIHDSCFMYSLLLCPHALLQKQHCSLVDSGALYIEVCI